MLSDIALFDIALALVILLYLAVAAFAFFATASEQQRFGVRSSWMRPLSALACLFWPLMALVMFLMQRMRPAIDEADS